MRSVIAIRVADQADPLDVARTAHRTARLTGRAADLPVGECAGYDCRRLALHDPAPPQDGVGVETRQLERCAEALGREVAADECAVTEQTAPAPAPTMYLGLDGTGVAVRPAEVEGRRGKRARHFGRDP